MRALLLLIAMCFVLSPAHAQSARRVALVIGVTDYDAVANLTNPRDGARRVYEALRAVGFAVDEPLDSPTKAQLDAALLDFSRRADTADVALLYFAGHGMQQFDDNWLIPRNARLRRPQDVRVEGARLQDIVGLMSGARLRIIILDACRNNPFSTHWPPTQSPADGLAEVAEAAVPTGTVLAYSAGPRQLAPDNGVFAQALAENMQVEGLELRQVLGRTRDAVTHAAPQLQPTITVASNTAPFFFRGAPAAANTAPTPTLPSYVSVDQAPDARQTPSDVRAPLVRSEDVSRLRDFALFRECEHCPEMVVLPAGSFLMGSPQGEADRVEHEDSVAGAGGAQVPVSIRRFAIGRFELTAAGWFACVDAGGGCYEAPRGEGRVAVAEISWRNAQTYLNWLNQRGSGAATLVSAGGAGRYRLPSESEWEYAARARTTTAYGFGDDPAGLGDYAWFGGSNGNAEGRAREVGGKRANQFGLHDMHGNVWEWVQDCHANSYANLPRDGSAYPDPCSLRMLRGGSWFDIPRDLRSAHRFWLNPGIRSDIIGIRVARTL